MSQRLLRVRELLKREIGSLISQDYEFNALVTVNDVDVTPDLRNGHVFIGVIGSDQEKVKIVKTLNSDRGMIQKKISKRVVMKFTPKLHFKSDESIERGVKTLKIIESLGPINSEEDDESLNGNIDD
ncbi:MAG: 30S ribosome-binding factor RbfA [Verrucomicrobiota bacterium]|jgi:ribosome-binding factor A|nr:30S ribosome-binding factor RbfA [Verrucomicrobiota bacterium]MEC8905518.1 30S ribosome-binding factor RbfA [Verrucomicrobiota bacterium]MED6298473.1 30S ribosome-binding factor RbfA [Verrucomicrobiota bacterium]MEE3176376.1 30S ribosome-binding factor RbfA [Verrucomicrobiota bacterium]